MPCRWGWVLVANAYVSFSVIFATISGPTRVAATSDERQLLVLPTAFAPANHGVAYFRRFSGLGPLCMSRGSGYFTAALDLPEGSVVKKIRATFDDNSETSVGTLALYRLGITRVDLLALTPMSQPRPRPGVTEAAVEPEEAVRDGFRYVLHLTLTGPGVCLRSAEVFYREPK